MMFDSTTLRTLYALLRPQTYILMCVYFVVGLSYAMYDTGTTISALANSLDDIILLLLGIALWYIAGTALNDYSDYEIDKINLSRDKQRPLVMGIVGKDELLRIAIFSSFGALLCSVNTGNLYLILLFGVLLVLNWAYSMPPFSISRRGGLAPLLLPLGYVVLTVTSGLLVDSPQITPAGLLLIATLYIHFLSRILLKDYRDVVGDKKVGKITLLLKKGNAYIVRLSIMCFSISLIGIVYLLPKTFTHSLAFILFFSAFCIWSLWTLSQKHTWDTQRAYITMFGRSCTAILSIFVLSLLTSIHTISSIRMNVSLVSLGTIFVWSIFEILKFQSTPIPIKKQP